MCVCVCVCVYVRVYVCIMPDVPVPKHSNILYILQFSNRKLLAAKTVILLNLYL